MQMNAKERKSMQINSNDDDDIKLKYTSTLKIVIVSVVQCIIARPTSVTLRGSSISSRVSQKTACSEFCNWQGSRRHKLLIEADRQYINYDEKKSMCPTTIASLILAALMESVCI